MSEINEGWHGVARDQFLVLYPAFRTAPIRRVFYSGLGLTRFYTYTITINGGPQNVSTAIQVDDKIVETASSPDKDEGFAQVSITFAEKDPSISRRVRIWALIVMGIGSFVSILPFVGLTAKLMNFHVDLLALSVGFGCLFFAYIGTRT